jgi:EmrB/QacA subfamily drug resistance transporter
MPPERSLRFLLWLVATGFFMQTLDSTIVNTALPAMAASLGEKPLSMQSVVIAYALTMAMLIPASGWIADRFGLRRAFMSAIVLFVLGSILCAASRSLIQLTAARVIQGGGGAMLLPVGRLAVLRAYPRERLLQAMSIVGVPGMVGPLVGPTLGGWVVEISSWHWIFLINIPIGLLGGIATAFYMPDDRVPEVPRFDISGYLLLAAGMVATSFALDGLSELSFPHATVLILLVFGLASLAAYWLRAAQQPHPLFPPKIFETHTFSIGLLGNLFARLGSGSMPFLVPLLLQVTLGYTPFHAGMMMLPTSVAAILSKRIVTPLITRVGYRRILVINTILLGAAMATFSLISLREPLWLTIVQLAFFGCVNSLQFTAMNTVTLKDLDSGQATSGNSLLSMVQMLSMSLGVAAAGGLLATFVAGYGHGRELFAFHATFICVGLMTSASAGIFWQLSADVTASHGKTEAAEMG